MVFEYRVRAQAGVLQKQRFETVEDIKFSEGEHAGFLFLLILKKFKRHLTREDFLSFNLGANLDHYIMPGWNLIPKVHKLTEKTGVAMEPLLGALFLSKATK